MKDDIKKYRRAKNREKALEQGFYDGRFKSKRYETKKEKHNRKRYDPSEEDCD